MSPGHRYAMQRDKSEKAIVDALLKVGAKVIRLTEFDLLVLYRYGQVTMLECKSTRGKKQTMRAKTETQEQLIRDGWPLYFVSTPEEALAIVQVMER